MNVWAFCLGKQDAEPKVQSKEVVIEKPIIFWSMGEIETDRKLEYFIKELLLLQKNEKEKPQKLS